MPRIHFYHTVLRRLPEGVEPLENVEAVPFAVNSSGVEGAEGVAYAARTGGTAGNTISDENGVVQFYLDPGDYNVHFTDLDVPDRIDDFVVGVNGASGTLHPSVAALETFAATPLVLAQLATSLQNLLVPAGTIVATGRSTMPGSGPPYPWLLCDGSSLSTTTYATLFAAIGYEFGGAGSAFDLPDFSIRVPVGRWVTAPGDPYPFGLGDVGGDTAVTLSEAELPGHSHPSSSLGSSYRTPVINSAWVQVNFGDGTSGYKGPGTLVANPAIISDDATGDTGGSEAHNNMQPYVTVNYMIKT